MAQVLAVEKSIRTKRENEFTKVYQDVQKEALVNGTLRVYAPKDDAGERLPPESKRVTLRVGDALQAANETLRALTNLTALRDATNMTAKADIVVDERVIARDVPAVHLLFLEKRISSIIEFFSKLPVLSAEKLWTLNEATGLFETAPESSMRTRKVESFPVVVPATDKHPAQIQKVTVDETVGTWSTTQLSGATTSDRKAQLLARAEKMLAAVKVAREEANRAPVVDLATGNVIDYLFAP